MIVYAVDVALANVGVVVIRKHKGNWRIIHDEIIKTKSLKKELGLSQAQDEVRRIHQIMDSFIAMMDRWAPDAFVAELPHGGARNARAMGAMSIAKGLIVAMSRCVDAPLTLVTPTEVKVAATGYKDAEKEEVIDEIVKLFPKLGEKYVSKSSASGWRGDFEHVADAVGAFIAGKELIEDECM